MNQYIDKTYWIAVAHLPKWTIERTNRFIISVIHENKMTWADFFALERNSWKDFFAFTDKELTDLAFAKTDLPRLAFIAEQLHNEGFQIIPINSPDYPPVLKENLKIKSSAPVLYVRLPEPKEKNANLKLIELGALPVNMAGETMNLGANSGKQLSIQTGSAELKDPDSPYGKRNIEKELLEYLKNGTYTAKEILLGLKLDWDSRKLSTFLKKNPNIIKIDGKPAKFTRNKITNQTLFE